MSKSKDELFPCYKLGDFVIQLRFSSSDARKYHKQLLDSLSPFEVLCSIGKVNWILNIIPSDNQEVRVTMDQKSELPDNWTTLLSGREHLQATNSSNIIFPENIDNSLLLAERTLYCIYLLATTWHAYEQGLSLHSTAISNNNIGYLFLGESGAGKSTVASLCASINLSVIGEDRVFLFTRYDGEIMVAAAPVLPHKPIVDTKLIVPLRGIFTLIKDNADSLKHLSQYETANALFEGFLQHSVVGHLPSIAFQRAFATTCETARRIPGYELHFRKSPDFWKLIDEQFSD